MKMVVANFPGKSVAENPVMPPTLSAWADKRTASVPGISTGLGDMAFNKVAALFELGFFTGIERSDGTVIAHDTGPDFAGLALAVLELDYGIWCLFIEVVEHGMLLCFGKF